MKAENFTFNITVTPNEPLLRATGQRIAIRGGYQVGGERVRAHYARVGARPAVAHSRELDDLDERQLRHHPELRAGRPY